MRKERRIGSTSNFAPKHGADRVAMRELHLPPGVVGRDTHRRARLHVSLEGGEEDPATGRDDELEWLASPASSSACRFYKVGTAVPGIGDIPEIWYARLSDGLVVKIADFALNPGDIHAAGGFSNAR